MLSRTNYGLSGMRHKLIFDRLIKGGAVIVTRTKVTRIEQNGLVFAEVAGREVQLGNFDHVVMAVGYSSVDSEWKKSRPGVPMYLVGDVVEPRSILEAVAEGWKIASALE